MKPADLLPLNLSEPELLAILSVSTSSILDLRMPELFPFGPAKTSGSEEHMLLETRGRSSWTGFWIGGDGDLGVNGMGYFSLSLAGGCV